MPGARLTLEERAQIQVLFAAGERFPAIAAAVGRDRTTIWREVTRNNAYRGAHLSWPGARHPDGRRDRTPAGLGGAYRWVYEYRTAHRRAGTRARRPRAFKLHRWYAFKATPPLWEEVVLPKLLRRWSPVQISMWLRREFPDRPEMWVSHETIYQAIYFQAKGQLRRDLAKEVLLRSGRARRQAQSRAGQVTRSRRAWIGDLHVSARPAEAEDRAVPGHWEGDLVIGARGTSAIITLVERHSRYVMLGALPDSRSSAHVIPVLVDLMGRLPVHLARSLTWDQGAELAQHATFTLATDCKVYFCDPHSPWQRGSNENTNGLLRQYFPRSSTDFRAYTQAQLDDIAHELNTRPRQTLNWNTPAEALNTHLVATAT